MAGQVSELRAHVAANMAQDRLHRERERSGMIGSTLRSGGSVSGAQQMGPLISRARRIRDLAQELGGGDHAIEFAERMVQGEEYKQRDQDTCAEPSEKRADAPMGTRDDPNKDPEKKVHPCMVPYDQLPKEQQVKDAIFVGIVHAMLGL